MSYTRLILLLCLLMTACTPHTPQPAVTITDAAGEEVRLAGTPRRLVVTGTAPFMPLHLLAMFPDAAGRLAGYEQKGPANTPFLPLVNPLYGALPALAPNPGPEQIASLHPDLVVMKSTTPTTLSRTLKPLHIPVLHVGMENPAQFCADVQRLGAVLDEPQRAGEIVTFYEQRLRHIRTRLNDVPRRSTLVLSYRERGEGLVLSVPAASWIQTVQVREGGGDPVWLHGPALSGGWTVTGFEQVAAWDPEVIVLIVWYRHDPAAVLRTLEADPHWRRLQAVQNGNLHVFPGDLFGWDSPDPRWLLGLEWMARTLHPERLADLDLKQELRAFYGELYGLEPRTIETMILPEAKRHGL